MVRPWNASSSARMRVRDPSPRFSLASLTAASIASVPELPKNTRPCSARPGEALQPLGEFDLGAGGEVVAHVHERRGLRAHARPRAPDARARAR